MSELLFTGLVLAVAVVTWLALSARQSARRRFVLVGVCTVTFLIIGVVAEEFLGLPKPIAIEWRDGAATVIAHQFIEGEAIYLWLVWPDENLPRAYVLPWDEQTAREMAQAREDVEQDGGEVVAEFGNQPVPPGERRDDEANASTEASLEDRDFTINAVPHPRPPDKPDPTSARPQLFVPRRS